MMYAKLRDMYIYDNTLFDKAKMPENLVKETLIEIILDECGDNEVLYDNPEILKMMINAFFESGYYKYKGLADSTQYEYDPLINYDLTITESRDRNNDRKTTSEGTSDTETKVSAFNSNSYSPDRSGNDSSKVNESENSKEKEEVTRREFGDNSARSTQYMIKEQRDILNFNVYKVIASDFEDEITIPVYTKRSWCDCRIGGY